jgi:hypothetical protein
MATTTKKRSTDKKKEADYANDPFFIKKREMALKLIKKAGLPKTFTKKKNAHKLK